MKEKASNFLSYLAVGVISGASGASFEYWWLQNIPSDLQSEALKELTDYEGQFRSIAESRFEGKFDGLVGNYGKTSLEFERIFAQTLSIVDLGKLGSSGPPIVSVISQKAYEHVISGVYLAKLALPITDTIQISPDRKNVVFGSVELDFNNPLHIHLADAILRTKFNLYLMSRWPSLDRRGDYKKSQQDLKDLAWFAQQSNLPIFVIEPGSFAIIPKDHLLSISRVLQLLRQIDIPFPSVFRFKNWEGINNERHMEGAGYYEGYKNRIPFRITITNVAGSETVEHEIGHFISDASHKPESQPRLKEFSQEAFEQIIEAIEETDLVEEYAEAFVRSYRHGNTFRESIIQSKGAKKAILAAEYNFFKALFNGQEFRNEGGLVKHLDPEAKISQGDVITISDTDIEVQGILLRPIPSLAKHPSFPIVEDNYKVRIIGGPVVIKDEQGKEVEMWQVQVVNLDIVNEQLAWFALPQFQGWISRQWFGEVVNLGVEN